MITSAKVTPKLFSRLFFYGLVDRPIFNTLALGLPLLVVVFLHGFRAGVITAAIIAFIAMIVYGIVSSVLFMTYRSKDHKMTLAYKVDPSTIRITYGDHTSAHNQTTILRKTQTRKAWVYGRGIYVRHNSMTHCLLIPDGKRTKFIQAMKKNGWFAIPKLPIRNRIFGSLGQSVIVTSLALAVFFAFPGGPKATPVVTGQTPAMAIKTTDIFQAINDERTTLGRTPLQLDDKLTVSANRSCQDMATYKYFGSKNPVTGHSGYEYMTEYYADRWIVEVSLPITESYSSEQVVSRWVDNSGANIAVLDDTYRIGAVAKCAYTSDKTFNSIIVLHLAS